MTRPLLIGRPLPLQAPTAFVRIRPRGRHVVYIGEIAIGATVAETAHHLGPNPPPRALGVLVGRRQVRFQAVARRPVENTCEGVLVEEGPRTHPPAAQ